MKKIIVLMLLLSMTACASSRGFDRGRLQSQIAEEKVISDADIRNVLALKPQLPYPYNLAVYFAPTKSNRYGRSWDWRSEDKDIIIGMANDLKATGAISNVTFFNSDLVEGSDNRAIRLAAARTGADAVLIIKGTTDIDRYNNAAGYTYILLVTALFVPGTVADGLFMANATMWDVRNEYLYLSAEAEGTSHQTKPAAFIDEAQLVKAARSDALTALKKELSARLTKLNSK